MIAELSGRCLAVIDSASFGELQVKRYSWGIFSNFSISDIVRKDSGSDGNFLMNISTNSFSFVALISSH